MTAKRGSRKKERSLPSLEKEEGRGKNKTERLSPPNLGKKRYCYSLTYTKKRKKRRKKMGRFNATFISPTGEKREEGRKSRLYFLTPKKERRKK